MLAGERAAGVDADSRIEVASCSARSACPSMAASYSTADAGSVARVEPASAGGDDAAIDGQSERAEQVATSILEICIDAGGSGTGEHGVGVDRPAACGCTPTPIWR